MGQVEHKRHRVIVLCNPSLHTQATASVLMRAGVNVVGIVAARERAGFERVRSSIKRNGVSAFVSRGLARLLLRCLNGRHDSKVYDKLYDRNEIEASISSVQVPVKICARYDEQDVLDWIRKLAPDILVVHSGMFVPRSVRELPRTGLVIGGHPGLTQFFRGGSSSFWAIYHNRPEDVGWTVFHVDKGVDTGDVIAQGRMDLEQGDSFVSIDWRAMLCIAKEQARLIERFDNGDEIPRQPHGRIDTDTLYWHPTLLEFIRYRRRQQRVH